MSLSNHPLECLPHLEFFYLSHRTHRNIIRVLSSVLSQNPGWEKWKDAHALPLLRVQQCPPFSRLLQISLNKPMGTAGPHRAKAQWLAYDLQLPGPIGDAALGHLPVAKRPHQSSVGAI